MEKGRWGRDSVGSHIPGQTNNRQEGHQKHGEGRRADPIQGTPGMGDLH